MATVPVAFLVSALACASAETIPTEVYITMKVGDHETHFAIPETYLRFPQNRKGGEQDIVELSVSLPDVHSDFSDNYLPAIDPVVSVDGIPQFREQTRILLMRGRPYVQRLFRQDIEAMTNDTGRKMFGLRVFTYTRDLPNKSANGYFRDSVFYLIPPKDSYDNGQYFECYSQTFVDRCRGWANYNESLYYQYYFARDNLEHWRVLDTNVRALLEQFERRAKLAKHPSGGE